MQNSILIVSPFFSPNIGGVETHLNDLISELELAKIPYLVSTYEPLLGYYKTKWRYRSESGEIYRAKHFLYKCFDKIDQNPILATIYLFPILFIQTFIICFIHRRKIKVLHAHGLISCMIGYFISKIFRIKYIVSTHAIYEFNLESNLLNTFVIRIILKNSRKILCLSEQSVVQINKIDKGMMQVEKYSYWVDINKFKPMAVKRVKVYTVLFVGRLLEKKGVNLVIEIAEKMPNVKFIIIGLGPLEKKVKNASLKITNLEYIGAVENSNLPGYYSSADLLIVPSIYEEGMARVKMEAISSGLPVLVSDYPGLRENLSRDVSMVVSPTVDNFYNSINRLKSTNLDKDKIRQYGIEKFSSKNFNSILKSYNEQ